MPVFINCYLCYERTDCFDEQHVRFSIANITINKNVLSFYCNELCGRQLSCFMHKCNSVCDGSSDQSFMGCTN